MTRARKPGARTFKDLAVTQSRNQIVPLRRLISRNSSIIPLKAPVAEHYKDAITAVMYPLTLATDALIRADGGDIVNMILRGETVR